MSQRVSKNLAVFIMRFFIVYLCREKTAPHRFRLKDVNLKVVDSMHPNEIFDGILA